MQHKFILLFLILFVAFEVVDCRKSGGSKGSSGKSSTSSSSTSSSSPSSSSKNSGSRVYAGDSEVSPFAEFIAGIILFIASFPILWLNEYRAAENETNLEKAEKICVSTNCLEINPSLNQRLIHIYGKTCTANTLRDKKFGIQLNNCLVLKREVETFQWIRKEETEGVGKDKRVKVFFETEWSSKKQESYESFQNDEDDWTVKKKSKYVKEAYLGAYQLTKSQLKQAKNKKVITPENSWIQNCENSFPKRTQEHIKIVDDYIIFNKVKDNFTVGDQRTKFYKIECGDATVISQQKGNSFEPYCLKVDGTKLLDDYDEKDDSVSIYVGQDLNTIFNDEKVGVKHRLNRMLEPIKYIDWFLEKIFTIKEAFEYKLKESRKLTWAIRFLGYLLMCFGLMLFFSPIVYVISWFPFLGRFMAELSSFLFAVVSALIAVPLTLITIAIAWLRFHPIKGGLVLGAGALLGLLIWALIQKTGNHNFEQQ